MKVGPKSSLRPFLHRALQLLVPDNIRTPPCAVFFGTPPPFNNLTYEIPLPSEFFKFFHGGVIHVDIFWNRLHNTIILGP